MSQQNSQILFYPNIIGNQSSFYLNTTIFFNTNIDNQSFKKEIVDERYRTLLHHTLKIDDTNLKCVFCFLFLAFYHSLYLIILLLVSSFSVPRDKS